MFKTHLLTAFRNLKKNKTFSLINIVGLAIGMAACLVILHYVSFEKSYDRYHDNSDRIYRLRYERTDGAGTSVKFASCCPPAAARIRGNYPEVEKIGRIFKWQSSVSYEDTEILEERLFFAETELLEILKFDFVEGIAPETFGEPNKAFLSRSMARKYFGDQSALGKILTCDKKTDYEIVGIFEDVPGNSHLKIDMLLPWENLVAFVGTDYTEAWGHTGAYTYILAQPGIDPPAFEEKLQGLIVAECPWLDEYNMRIDLRMQPLTDIHLTSHYMQEYEANGNRDSVDVLFLIAIFVMIIAWVNFASLSTARSINRAREVGLRKAVGASRRQLMVQFFAEILLTNIFSMLVAAGFILLALPYFSQITGIPADHSVWTQQWFWISMGVMLMAGVFLSGIYPVIVMSSFKPATVLKGKLGHSTGGVKFRRALVVFQFTVGLVLIIATFVVFKQISFMRNQKLGFAMDQTLVVKAPRVRDDAYGTKFDSFKETLLQQVDISKISHVTEVPGRQIYWDAGAIRRAGEEPEKGKNYQIVGIDYDFADLFELEFAAGRNFAKEFTSDNQALILNETAVQHMGFEDAESAIGEEVDYWGEIFTIVGVMKDYHQQSLKEQFEPHIFRFSPHGRGTMGMIAIKLNIRNVTATVEEVQQLYDEFFPGNSFDYFFLDDYYNQQYASDELFGNVYSLFSLLAIVIIALGVYGLSSFSVTQRTKEIGIRKVLGASVASVFRTLTKEFAALLVVANIIAWPIAYIAMNRWLEGYAYRTSIGPTTFILAGLSVLVLVAVTVSYQVTRAALANPVKAIQHE